MTRTKASDVIQMLGLQPLPGEGGYYRETYRSKEVVEITFPGEEKSVARSLNTQIYYMVTEESFSVLHRLKQDEVYHYYSGLPSELFLIFPSGGAKIVKLGPNINKGEIPQLLIPAGTWQGVRLENGRAGWSLMGTSVSPGFDFSDFEAGTRERLVEQYPDLKNLITLYTKNI